jgi:DNA-binding protein HU-beta
MASGKTSAVKAKAAAPAATIKGAPAAKAGSASKQDKAEIVTLRQLAEAVSEAHGISQKQANELLSGAITSMTVHLKKGARIRVAGLGTFEVRKRAARMGRNPATGEAIKIKASKKVAFRAAKDLSESI